MDLCFIDYVQCFTKYMINILIGIHDEYQKNWTNLNSGSCDTLFYCLPTTNILLHQDFVQNQTDEKGQW